MDWFWLFAIVIGPLLLLGWVIYAMTRNKAGGRRDIARAERGARELREELSREDEN